MIRHLRLMSLVAPSQFSLRRTKLGLSCRKLRRQSRNTCCMSRRGLGLRTDLLLQRRYLLRHQRVTVDSRLQRAYPHAGRLKILLQCTVPGLVYTCLPRMLLFQSFDRRQMTRCRTPVVPLQLLSARARHTQLALQRVRSAFVSIRILSRHRQLARQ